MFPNERRISRLLVARELERELKINGEGDAGVDTRLECGKGFFVLYESACYAIWYSAAKIKATKYTCCLFQPQIDPPSWITRPSDQTVVEAATATFHCSAVGNPVPTIVWLKDGKTVGTGNTLNLTTSRNQSGEYWCSAENELKTVNTSVNLDVQCKSEIFYKENCIFFVSVLCYTCVWRWLVRHLSQSRNRVFVPLD